METNGYDHSIPATVEDSNEEAKTKNGNGLDEGLESMAVLLESDKILKTEGSLEKSGGREEFDFDLNFPAAQPIFSGPNGYKIVGDIIHIESDSDQEDDGDIATLDLFPLSEKAKPSAEFN